MCRHTNEIGIDCGDCAAAIAEAWHDRITRTLQNRELDGEF